MKKFLSTIAAVCLSVTLVACGGGSSAQAGPTNEDLAKEVCNNFFKALQEGDVEKAKTFANDTVQADLDEIVGAFSEVEELLEKYKADDETKEKFRSIIGMIVSGVFEKDEITETEELTDTQFVFTVNNTGVNLNSVSHLDNALDMDAFTSGIQDELVSKYQEEGEDAAMSWMMAQMADYMIDSLKSYMATEEREDNTMKCTVEKVDDNWIITNMQ